MATNPPNDITVRLDMAQLVNLVQITVYPVETVGSPAVLWTAHTVLRLAPGQTRVLYAPFHDDNGERVAAVDVKLERLLCWLVEKAEIYRVSQGNGTVAPGFKE